MRGFFHASFDWATAASVLYSNSNSKCSTYLNVLKNYFRAASTRYFFEIETNMHTTTYIGTMYWFLPAVFGNKLTFTGYSRVLVVSSKWIGPFIFFIFFRNILLTFRIGVLFTNYFHSRLNRNHYKIINEERDNK